MKDHSQLKLFYRSLVASFLVVNAFLSATAQVYPIQANIQLVAPYSPYLSDYTVPGSQNLILLLRTNDVNLGDHAVKLSITIDGVGITIRTKQSAILAPIAIQGSGIPMRLYGEDLAEYFHPANLDFAGLSRQQFEKTGRLPEGVYRFSVEVLDYNRNTVLSNKGFTVAWMILNDPPLLNLPRPDTKVRILDPTNIPFTWTPRHTSSPNSAFSTEYTFRLVEIWPENRNPYDAFLSQPVLYEVITTQSQIIYGVAEPALIPGRKYAWQVQARDVDGKDLFKNQGKSEVYVFQFGDALGVPENFRQEAATASTLSFRWEPATNGEMPDQYRIRYKTSAGDTWYETVAQQRWSTLSQLLPNTAYEAQIRAEKGKLFSEYSPSVQISTAAADKNKFSCGTESVYPPAGEPVLTMAMAPGDVFHSRNFSFTITSLTRSVGTFDGEALMPVPWFNGASVKVKFSGVKVDRNYEMVAGVYKTVYNAGSALSQVVDEMHKIGEKKEVPVGIPADTTKVLPSNTHVVPGIIKTVEINSSGEIVVTTENGTQTTYDQPTNPETQEKEPVRLTDSGGNTYTIGKDGKVTKSAGGAGQGTNVLAADPIKDRLIVLILEKFDEAIGAWLRINGKGGEEDVDVLLAEELPSCFPKDAGILKPVRENTIPYYKAHPAELRAKIEADESNRKLLDEVKGLFNSADEVDISGLSGEQSAGAENAVCEALIDGVEDLEPEAISSLIDYEKLVNWLVSNKGRTVAYDFSEFISEEIYEKIVGKGIVQKIPVDKLFYGTINGERKAFTLRGTLSIQKGTVNLDPNAGKIGAGIAILHAEDRVRYTLAYQYSDSNEMAIVLETNDKDEMAYLFLEQNITYRDWYKQRVIATFKQEIRNSSKDCDRLDYIYENIPDFVSASLNNDEDNWAYLQSLSSCRIDKIGTNESRAIVNLLKTISASYLRDKADAAPAFLMDIFDRLGSAEKMDFAAVVLKKFDEVWTGDEQLEDIYPQITEYTDDSHSGNLTRPHIKSCFSLEGNTLLFAYKILYQCPDGNFSDYPCPTKVGDRDLTSDCSDQFTLRGSSPVVVKLTEEDYILPAFIAGQLLRISRQDDIDAGLSWFSQVLLPNVVLKPATLTKWNRFFGTVGKEAAQQGVILNYEKLAVQEGVNLTNFVARTSDQYIDVVVHFSDGKFMALIEEGGVFVEKVLDAGQLASMLNGVPAEKYLRLLSCNDLATAKQLSAQLPGRTLYASDGWVDLYADGAVVSQHKFKKLVNGDELSEMLMDGQAGSTTSRIRLGSANEMFGSFSRPIDFGGGIVKRPGVKLNILGRANAKNGTMSPRRIYDELIARGVPESELTGLFRQMPAEWDALTVMEMNARYWDEINMVHIDDIIANGGDIRFIHDPRLEVNQWNYVREMQSGAFKNKCVAEKIVRLRTYLSMEYEYLLRKGYVLQENGLMTKP